MANPDNNAQTSAPNNEGALGRRFTFGPTVHGKAPDELSPPRDIAPGLNSPCITIRVISKSSIVLIKCAGAVTDNDDTVLLHTGEHIHDGHRARFALALSKLLFNAHQENGGTLLQKEHIEAFTTTGTIFTPESWDQYRQQTGRSEDAVLAGIVSLANARFQIQDAQQAMITHDAYKRAVKDVLTANFPDFMQQVVVDSGLTKLFGEMKQRLMPVGVCSASSETFVRGALAIAGVTNLFDCFVCGAVKKLSSGEYSGSDLLRTCRQLNIEPQGAVMFGDTMNDIGAAALAGVPVIIIRVPGGLAGDNGCNASLVGQVHKQILNQVETFSAQANYHTSVSQHGYAAPPTVLLVDDFAQVKLDSKIAEGSASFSVIEAPLASD